MKMGLDTTSGDFAPRASIKTIATAMDVGAPSNFERLAKLINQQSLEDLNLSVSWHSDDQIANAMRREYGRNHKIFCPHTASAFSAFHKFPDGDKDENWTIVATADSSKFSETIQYVLGVTPDLSDTLTALLNRPAKSTECAGSYAAYSAAVINFLRNRNESALKRSHGGLRRTLSAQP